MILPAIEIANAKDIISDTTEIMIF